MFSINTSVAVIYYYNNLLLVNFCTVLSLENGFANNVVINKNSLNEKDFNKLH